MVVITCDSSDIEVICIYIYIFMKPADIQNGSR